MNAPTPGWASPLRRPEAVAYDNTDPGQVQDLLDTLDAVAGGCSIRHLFWRTDGELREVCRLAAAQLRRERAAGESNG